MRLDEHEAATVLESALGLRVELHDTGASPGMYDLSVRDDGGAEVGAVEVSILGEEARIRLDAALDEHRPLIDTDDLNHSWWVRLSKAAIAPGPRYRDIRLRIVSHLAEIEAEGLRLFEAWHRESSRAVARLMDELPIAGGGVWVGPNSPVVVIHGPIASAYVSGELAVETVESALAGERLEGERRKLAASGLPSRHLFLWLDRTLWAPWVGLTDGAPPERFANLPEEVTDVWIGAWPAGPRGPTYWRASVDDPWEVVGERAA